MKSKSVKVMLDAALLQAWRRAQTSVPFWLHHLYLVAPTAALHLQARRKASVEAAYGKLVWTGLGVAYITSAHLHRRAQPTAGKARAFNCWLKTTMNINYFTVSMCQDWRNCLRDGFLLLFLHDGVCMWLLELLQLFCHHEGSHLEKETYRDIKESQKNNQRDD